MFNEAQRVTQSFRYPQKTLQLGLRVTYDSLEHDSQGTLTVFKSVRVKQKKKEFFYRPKSPDRDDVSPKFIVCLKVKVQCLGRNRIAEDENCNEAFVGWK